MNRPTKEELEQFLEKKVKIIMYDGEEIEGELHKCEEDRFKNNLNLSLHPNHYVLLPNIYFLFRVSHIKRIEKIYYQNKKEKGISK